MDINPEDESSFTTKYQEAFLQYVENEDCAEHRPVPVIKPESIPTNYVFPAATGSGSGQSSFDPYDVSRDDEEYFPPNNVAETICGQSDHSARLMTADRVDLNSPPDSAKKCGQVNPILNDDHCDQMQFGTTFWLPDITDWWRQEEQTHSKYTDHPNVARDIVCIISYGVGVEASFSLWCDFISWRQSNSTGKTLREKVAMRQFDQANQGRLSADDPAFDTVNREDDSEMKQQAEERKLNRMAKVHDCLEMWQGCQNLGATRKESRTNPNEMTAVG